MIFVISDRQGSRVEERYETDNSAGFNNIFNVIPRHFAAPNFSGIEPGLAWANQIKAPLLGARLYRYPFISKSRSLPRLGPNHIRYLQRPLSYICSTNSLPLPASRRHAPIWAEQKHPLCVGSLPVPPSGRLSRFPISEARRSIFLFMAFGVAIVLFIWHLLTFFTMSNDMQVPRHLSFD
jgi:hypothetical protein